MLPHRPGRAHPYLYSNDEVRKLLQAAQRLAVGSRSAAAWTYHCLLGLLAVTGLRISEARNLQTEDVDLKEGVLTIRGAKFGKSRLVPIHPSTRKVLSDYASRRDHCFWPAIGQRHFFVSGRGTGWTEPRSGARFTILSRQIGLRALRIVMGHVCTIFVIGSLWKRWSSGIGPVKTWSAACQFCRRTWGMFTWPTPTGT